MQVRKINDNFDKTKLEIRKYRPGDLSVVLRIALVAWKPIFASYKKMLGPTVYKAVYPDWKAKKIGEIAFSCRSSDYGKLVAIVDDKIVGFTTFHQVGKSKVGEIDNNAVDPKFQGNGIGSALHKAALAEMEAKGLKFAMVRTGLDDAHIPARKSYEKAGFNKSVPSIKFFQKI